MGSKYTSSTFRGIGLLDPRFGFAQLDTDNTTATQADPEADQPIPVSGSRGYSQLEAFGAVTPGVSLDVLAKKSGRATGNIDGARLVWKKSTEASTAYKGWLNYNKATGFEFVLFHGAAGNPGTSTVGYQAPDGLRTADHTAVVVYEDHVVQGIAVATRGHSVSTWTHTAVVSLSGVWNGKPSVVQLRGGRLLCFYVLKNLSEGGVTYFTLGMSYSDDVGATWTIGGVDIPGIKIDSTNETLNRLRARVHGDFITLIIGRYNATTPASTIEHFVSADLGASFVQITETSAIGYGANWDLVALPDDSVLFVGVESAASTSLRRFQKTQPFAAFNDDPDGGALVHSLCENVSVDHPLVSAVVDDLGFVYVLFCRDSVSAASAPGRCRHSLLKLNSSTLAVVDDLNTAERDDLLYRGLTALTNAPNEPLDTGGDDNVFLSHFALMPWRSSLLLLTNFSGQAAMKCSIGAVFLGGHSTIDWREQTYGIHGAATPDRNGMVYLPFESPTTIGGWTVLTSGTAPTITITTDGAQMTASAGTYTVRRAGSTAGNPILVHVRIKLTSAADLSSSDVAIRVEQGDSSTGYQASLRFTDTGARLYDHAAAAAVGSDITGLQSGIHHDYFISLEAGKIAVFYKSPVLLSEWSPGPAGALTNAGAGVTNRIDWGHLSNASGTFTGASQWLFLGCALDDCATATGIPDSYQNPGDLIGRPIGHYQQFFSDGYRGRGIGSSAYANDAWTMPIRYGRGLQLLDPAGYASPSVQWASTDDADNQEIHYALEGSRDAGLLSSSIYALLVRPNFRMAYFEGYDGASWTTILTLDSADRLNGLPYARTGNEVTVNTAVSHTAERFVALDELVGGYVEFSGATFQIARNSEGFWTDGDQRRIVITLDGDPSAVASTGTCNIFQTVVCGVKHGVTAAYERYRLRIPAETTAEGYHLLGVFMAGPVAFFGQDPDWGWVEGIEPNTEIVEDRAGRRSAHKRGPARRRVEINWPSGWDSTGIYGSSPDPSYVVARDAAGFPGVGVQGDSAVLEGLVRRCEGGRYPVVYFPRLDAATVASSEFTYTGHEVLYGRPAGGITRQALVGEELSDAVYAVNSWTIEEEV